MSAKQGTTPTVAISIPASAGPTIRAAWTMTLLRLTALTTRSAPTISIDEALAGRVVDRVDRAHREDREVDHPGRDDAGRGDGEEADRGDRHQRLGGDQQPPLREAVGEQAAPGAEEQHRQELQRGGQADGDAAVGEA